MLQPYYQNKLLEAGCDEAGRGCLSGPVCAAAVILPNKFYHPLLNDSKTLKESVREELRGVILKEALAYGIAMVDHEEIDRINILKASIKAMHLAIDALALKPKYLIIDGNRFIPYPKTPHTCIIKGDSLYASIAAASVLAKTTRDQYMMELHHQFPQYGWNKNKGYGTLSHRKGIMEFGPSPFHRKSFKLLNNASLSLFENL
jgi:ribonuclease HII